MNSQNLLEIFKSTHAAISDLEKQISASAKILNTNMAIMALALKNFGPDALAVEQVEEVSLEDYWRDVMTTPTKDDTPSEFVSLCRNREDEYARAADECHIRLEHGDIYASCEEQKDPPSYCAQ